MAYFVEPLEKSRQNILPRSKVTPSRMMSNIRPDSKSEAYFTLRQTSNIAGVVLRYASDAWHSIAAAAASTFSVSRGMA